MMKFGEKFRYQFFAGVMFILLVGCQSFQPSAPGELAIKEGDFVGLWDAYNFCMVGRNIAQIQGNLTELKSAPRPISLNESPIPIPTFIKQWTSSRSSRLAVDPRAMAASCSIHLAEVAQHNQNFEAAYRILETMSSDFPEPQYAYYVAKANQTLEQLHSSFHTVSFSPQDAITP